MKTNDAIELFLEARVGIRQPKTILWYKGNLGLFSSFIGDKKEIENITIHDLRSWRATLVRRNLSAWSIHGYLRSVKVFFKWLSLEDVVPENPALRLEFPRLPQSPRRGILDKDRDAMILTARDRPRDFAIFMFAATTGCREDGLATLLLKNLNVKNMQAMVTEKGMKSRFVYFEDETKRALERWLDMRPLVETDRVFVSITGEPLTTVGIYQIFKRTAIRADVKDNWSPHQWRHAFARNFLKNGGGLGILSQLLGHSDVRVTLSHYGGLANEDLQRAHYKYVPKLMIKY